MAENPPDWAIERALALAAEGGQTSTPALAQVKGERPYVGYLVFARYIAEHEDPPVDPLWAEAMAFTNGRGWNGDSPVLPMVKFAYAAINRGIEIERERSDGR